MNEEIIQQKKGKRVKIILKNGFEYTTTIPEFTGTEFTFIDKFGKQITVSCSFIDYIGEIDE